MMTRTSRYWGLFWIAAGLSVHALVVGKLLGSTFFMMLFFWGFVAISALRGSLEAAQSMSIVMTIMLAGVTVMTVVRGTGDLAYMTFALYPALVSWISVFFYIRYLRTRDGGELARRSPMWRQRRVV